jgi:hypothetical protein
MPETVPRWLLAGAGIVALMVIFVGVKDFAERKSILSPPSGTGNPAIVPSDGKSAPKTTVKRKGAGVSAKPLNPSAAETLPAIPQRIPIMGEIMQAGARAPFVTEDDSKKGQPEPIENKRKAGPARCSPLPNSTKPEDVDASYLQNWAREYGCGVRLNP